MTQSERRVPSKTKQVGILASALSHKYISLKVVIESVTLVDAKWTQSVQTPNTVAIIEFKYRV